MALAAQSPLKQVTSQPPALQLPASLSKENCPSFPGRQQPPEPCSSEAPDCDPWKGKGLDFSQPVPGPRSPLSPVSPVCARSSLRGAAFPGR